MWVFLQIGLCATCFPGAHESQKKALHLLDLEFQILVSMKWAGGSNLGAQEVQPVLLTSEATLQPHVFEVLFTSYFPCF